MKCKFCNFDLPDGSKFCENCGAALTDPGVSADLNQGMSDLNAPPAQNYNAPQGGYQQQGYGQQNYGGGYQQPGDYGQPNYGSGVGFDASYNPGDGSPKYVGFGEAITLYFKNYINFNGRSTRSEYWWSYLFIFIVGFVIGIIEAIIGTEVISTLVELAFMIPSLAIGVRRLHDIGKKGTWILLNLIPLVGQIILIVWFCQPSVGQNEWGYPARPQNQ